MVKLSIIGVFIILAFLTLCGIIKPDLAAVGFIAGMGYARTLIIELKLDEIKKNYEQP